MHFYWNLIIICFARKYIWTGHLVLVYTVQLCAIIICYNYTNITPYGDTYTRIRVFMVYLTLLPNHVSLRGKGYSYAGESFHTEIVILV